MNIPLLNRLQCLPFWSRFDWVARLGFTGASLPVFWAVIVVLALLCALVLVILALIIYPFVHFFWGMKPHPDNQLDLNEDIRSET